jgi:serine/threonine protein kinase
MWDLQLMRQPIDTKVDMWVSDNWPGLTATRAGCAVFIADSTTCVCVCVTPRSLTQALGVLLYVLCYGRLPFTGDSKLQIINGRYDLPPHSTSHHGAAAATPPINRPHQVRLA